MQYTIRDVPKEVDRVFRRRAKEQGRSLNDILNQALATAAGVSNGHPPVKHRDLSAIAGTWVEDPEFDKAIAEMDRIDPELWR